MSDASVTAAIGAAIEPEGDEVQLDLLDPNGVVTVAGRELVERRGRGRPAGARNKRTERTVKWLMARHRDPREVLLAVVDMHPADLAVLLGCTPFQALQEIRLCAIAVLPFVAQKQPLAIDVNNRQAVYLTIVEGQASQDLGDGFGIAARVIDAQQIQSLSTDGEGRVGQTGVGHDD